MDFAKTFLTLRSAADPVVCDTIAPIVNFDATQFVGTWYEQQHVQDPQEPSYYQCSTAQYYNLDTEAGTFKVYNSFQTPIFGLYTPRIGVHADAECDNEASCFVTFFGKKHDTPNLHIAETDYTSYAINYNCDVENNRVNVWLNSREPVISDDLFAFMYSRALELFPNFDASTFDPRLIQGSKCSYGDLPSLQ